MAIRLLATPDVVVILHELDAVKIDSSAGLVGFGMGGRMSL